MELSNGSAYRELRALYEADALFQSLDTVRQLADLGVKLQPKLGEALFHLGPQSCHFGPQGAYLTMRLGPQSAYLAMHLGPQSGYLGPQLRP